MCPCSAFTRKLHAVAAGAFCALRAVVMIEAVQERDTAPIITGRVVRTIYIVPAFIRGNAEVGHQVTERPFRAPFVGPAKRGGGALTAKAEFAFVAVTVLNALRASGALIVKAGREVWTGCGVTTG